MGVIKGIGGVVGVMIVTFLLVLVLMLPFLILFLIVGSIWAYWPVLKYKMTGRYGGYDDNPHSGYRGGGSGGVTNAQILAVVIIIASIGTVVVVLRGLG